MATDSRSGDRAEGANEMTPPACPGTEPRAVQLLTPEGERVANAEYDGFTADVTAADLRGLYRDMVLTRRFDAEATSLQRQGELGL
ncbi:pyruvate dehydrogenase (acetyl-transferring) E1 component subunit alpha, partial [Streptomyces sp. URMC 128]